MADITTLHSVNGNYVGPDSNHQFYLQLQIGAGEETSSGYKMYYRCLVYVAKNTTGTNMSSNLQCSWTSTKYALGTTTGLKADSGWIEMGEYAYGESIEKSANCYYTGGSGTTYKSTATATATVPSASTCYLMIEPNGGYFVDGGEFAEGNGGEYHRHLVPGDTFTLPVIRKEDEYGNSYTIANYVFESGGEQNLDGTWPTVSQGQSDVTGETWFLSDAYSECKIYPEWSENAIRYPFLVDLTDCTVGVNYNPADYSDLTLGYGESIQLPSVSRSGYAYRGWNVYPVEGTQDGVYNTSEYNESTLTFTQKYGLYKAEPIFEVTTEDDILGEVKVYPTDSDGNKIDYSFTYKNSTKYFRPAIGYTLHESEVEITIDWWAYGQMHSGYEWNTTISCEGQSATSMLTADPGDSYKNAVTISGTKVITKGYVDSTYTLTATVHVSDSGGGIYGPHSLSVDIPVKARENSTHILSVDANPFFWTSDCSDNSSIREFELTVGQHQEIRLYSSSNERRIEGYSVYLEDGTHLTDVYDTTDTELGGVDLGDNTLLSFDKQAQVAVFVQGNVPLKLVPIVEYAVLVILLPEGGELSSTTDLFVYTNEVTSIPVPTHSSLEFDGYTVYDCSQSFEITEGVTCSFTKGSSSAQLLIEDIEDYQEPLFLQAKWAESTEAPRAPQKVYAYYEAGIIYAKDFIVSAEFYIDDDGTIYAPGFHVGDSLYADVTGLTAVQFIKGVPYDAATSEYSVLSDNEGNIVVDDEGHILVS